MNPKAIFPMTEMDNFWTNLSDSQRQLKNVQYNSFMTGLKVSLSQSDIFSDIGQTWLMLEEAFLTLVHIVFAVKRPAEVWTM